MISWAIVGHQARVIEATTLANNLSAVLSLDDGTAGAGKNHLRAWELTEANPMAWAGVMEDDAEPVNGFNTQTEQALIAAPAPIISLYLGRERPRRFQHRIDTALHQADRLKAHWILSTHLLHAVAVAMRTTLRDDWLDWAAHSELPIDERLGAWARHRGHHIAYTVPSLVNHHDWPTLVNHRDGKPRDQPRRAWRTGSRDEWNSLAVPL